ncbi:MAG: leucine-rich repeat domain-containing protein, partial [Acutalibacteraceae bacterium]
AFSGCTSLKSITIPDSVTSIGHGAFYNTAWYNNQPDGLVYAGKVAYAYKGKMPKNTEIVLQDGTLSITDDAFYYRTGLTSITIPDSVTSIGDSAFSGCTSLESITIPDGVTYIGESAFFRCTSLESVAIGNGVTKIDDYAFEDCTSLTSVTIPDSVTSIGVYAFKGCTSLESVTIPKNITSISVGAFEKYTKIKRIATPDTPNKILSDKNLKEMEYRRDTDCDGIPDRIDPTKRYKDDESLEYNRDTDCDGLPDRIDSNDNDEKYQFKKVDNETFEKLSQSDIPIESMIKDDSILIKYQASDSEKVDNLLSSVGQKLAR